MAVMLVDAIYDEGDAITYKLEQYTLGMNNRHLMPRARRRKKRKFRRVAFRIAKHKKKKEGVYYGVGVANDLGNYVSVCFF